MTENKMSKRSFLKLFLSAFAFLSLGGLSFLIPNQVKNSSQNPNSGYGRGGYGN
jgi:hypothetical protein